MTSVESSKTHRLYLLLKERIATGVFAAGEQLPGEPALASAHGLSRVTVRRALDGLSRDGLITRHPGAGTFVRRTMAAEPLKGDLANMLAGLAAMGRDTDVTLLSLSYGEPPPSIAKALRLAPGERTQHALRVRSLDGAPFSYLATHVPERIGLHFGAEDLSRLPMLALLERSGVTADHAEQTISATLAGPEAAAALGVEVGAPLLSLIRVVRDRAGSGIEYLSALYRPDRHSFHMELTRAGEGTERYWQAATPAMARSNQSLRREAAPRRRRS